MRPIVALGTAVIAGCIGWVLIILAAALIYWGFFGSGDFELNGIAVVAPFLAPAAIGAVVGWRHADEFV